MEWETRQVKAFVLWDKAQKTRKEGDLMRAQEAFEAVFYAWIGEVYDPRVPDAWLVLFASSDLFYVVASDESGDLDDLWSGGFSYPPNDREDPTFLTPQGTFLDSLPVEDYSFLLWWGTYVVENLDEDTTNATLTGQARQMTESDFAPVGPLYQAWQACITLLAQV